MDNYLIRHKHPFKNAARWFGVRRWSLLGSTVIAAWAGIESHPAVCCAQAIDGKAPAAGRVSHEGTPRKPLARLEATPNPVPAGDGDGRTVIKWDTGDGTPGQVYPSAGGKPGRMVGSTAAKGQRTIIGIKPGTKYVFRLYAGTEKERQLAEIVVERASASRPAVLPDKSTAKATLPLPDKAESTPQVAANGEVTKQNTPPPEKAWITATPNPVPIGPEKRGTTTITWDTGDGKPGAVYCSWNDRPEGLFAKAAVSGSMDAPWIDKGGIYVFRLYAGKGKGELLTSVTVRAKESHDD